MMVTTRRSSGAVSLLRMPSNCVGEGLFSSMGMGGEGVALSLSPACVCGNGAVLSPFGVRGVPHSMQNFATGKLTVPQLGQTTSLLPHSRQNLAFGGLSV